MAAAGSPSTSQWDGYPYRWTSRVQAVVAMATPADMKSFAERTQTDATLAALISPVKHVTKDSAPVLLLHGTMDRTVPMAQSELFLAAYQKAGAKAELVKVDGAPHAFWNGQWINDAMARSAAFFQKHLGPVAAAAEKD